MDFSRRAHLHLVGAGLLALAGLGLPAHAEDYPNRAVRIVVPYAAGGAADPVGRLMADRLAKQTGNPFFVENRAGAGGQVGTSMALRSPPDGYTILIGASGLAINDVVSPNKSYDLEQDLTPLALISRVPMIVVASKQSGIKTIDDLSRVAKEKPGSLNYGIAGVGNMDHLVSERLRGDLGLDMVRIEYGGVPAALHALLSGEISIMTVSINAGMPQILADKIAPLAITAETRSPHLPDIPTMGEAGVSDFVIDGWFMLFAPSATPLPIKQKLHSEVHKALNDEGLRKIIVDSGGELQNLSLDELKAYLHRDIATFEDIVKRNDIKVKQ